MGQSVWILSWCNTFSRQPKRKLIMTKPHKRIKKFTPEFSEFIGRKQATRILAYKIIIAYVKEHNLQDPDDKTYFVPNKKMSKIFGSERIHLGGIQSHYSSRFATG